MHELLLINYYSSMVIHYSGLKIGGRTVASGELKLTRATKS